MDEHIFITDGRIETLSKPFFDDSLMTLSEWTQKHNGYSTKEALDLLSTEYGLWEQDVVNSGAHSIEIRKKKIKYTRLPLFWRSFFLFVYRYFFRLGFLDGKEGFLWHFLQGFWYRTLADAKVYEIKKQLEFNDEKIVAWVKVQLATIDSMGGGAIGKINNDLGVAVATTLHCFVGRRWQYAV